MSDLSVAALIILMVSIISYLFGKAEGWHAGRTVYRMWDSRRFNDILTKHLDIQTDDGCDTDYVRYAIKSAKDEYERSKP